jgi:phosphopantetheinyl transferase
MSIFWYKQSSSDVPDVNIWLSERERAYLEGLKFSKRRSDWRLGRWTAKRSVAAILGLPGAVSSLSKIEIFPSRSGAPMVFVGHAPTRFAISLSHRCGKAVCALGPASARIGCDLELVENRDAVFVSDYFAIEEISMLNDAPEEKRALIITLLWSAKESALKALHLGLRLDTRDLGVFFSNSLSLERSKFWLDNYPIGLADSEAPVQRDLPAALWQPFQVKLRNMPAFIGWWRNPDQFVHTLLVRYQPARCVEDSTDAGTVVASKAD